MIRKLALALCLLATPALPANAFTAEPPSRKTEPPYASTVLSRADARRLSEGLEAARRGDWATVQRLARSINDRDARNLLNWRYAAASSSPATFSDLDPLMSQLRGWPDPRTISARVEDLLADANLPASSRMAYFSRHAPISGVGKITYAEALLESGRRAEAESYFRDAWHNHPLSAARMRQILRDYPTMLSDSDHIQRVEYLLWTGQRSAASVIRRELPADYRKLVDARIALASGGRGVDRLIAAVPANLQSNAGLLYGRANWRRKRNRWEDALPLLLQIQPNDAPDVGEEVIWNEKNLFVRRAIRDDDFVTAYQLSAANGLSSGADFAEAEWMAGWIALTQQSNPGAALQHFTRLSGGVSTPISLARAHFWRGEALTALRRPDEAREAYLEATTHKHTFYGQLAAERIQDRTIAFTSIVPPSDAERTAFEARPLVRVLKMLAENGEDFLFRKFAFHLDDQLTTERDHQLLFELTERYNYPHVGIRGAKAGLSRGVVAPDAAFPLLDTTPLQPVGGVEQALVLALSRQESEFNPRAISRANARGLMQLLPSTARAQARREGLPYRQSWLIDDPEYNLTLGSAHLSDLIEEFNGSYIMAIAAYNAGASRPRRWVNEYGDPRLGEIGAVDWVESVPFSETRNYIQRVLENTQVYRHRLSGQPEAIRLSEDLERGR